MRTICAVVGASCQYAALPTFVLIYIVSYIRLAPLPSFPDCAACKRRIYKVIRHRALVDGRLCKRLAQRVVPASGFLSHLLTVPVCAARSFARFILAAAVRAHVAAIDGLHAAAEVAITARLPCQQPMAPCPGQPSVGMSPAYSDTRGLGNGLSPAGPVDFRPLGRSLGHALVLACPPACLPPGCYSGSDENVNCPVV